MVSPYLTIIRPNQWYKNLLIFIGLIFAKRFTEIGLYPILILGFFMLSLVSGASYIINDIVDIDQDRKHPEKKHRPLPSGKISKRAAAIYATFLLVTSVAISFKLNPLFGTTVLALFITSQLYTFWLKKIVFADVITIGVDFIWRAVSGVFLIQVKFSYWIVLCTFLLALLLALCKRKGDMLALGEKAPAHKEVLNFYTPELLNMSITMVASTLIVSYSMYSFISSPTGLMITTVPVATFLIFRYIYLVYINNPVSRHPEKVFFDKQFAVGLIIWLFMTLLILSV